MPMGIRGKSTEGSLLLGPTTSLQPSEKGGGTGRKEGSSAVLFGVSAGRTRGKKKKKGGRAPLFFSIGD